MRRAFCLRSACPWQFPFALLTLAFLAASAPAQDVLHVYATPGVYTQAPGARPGGANGFGGGDQTFSSADGWVFTPGANPAAGISFSLSQTGFPGFPQTLQFAGPSTAFAGPGTPLAVGNYPGGTAYPFEQQPGPNLGKPGFSFNGEAYADTSFQIFDLAYDPAAPGGVTRFAANFVQRDYSDPTRVIYGEIRYRSAVPVNAGPSFVQLGQSAYLVGPGGGVAVPVLRLGGSADALSVAYATADGTAKAGQDYTPAAGTLIWAAGDTAPKAIILPLLPDDALAGSVSFTLQLAGPSVVVPAKATVTIEGTAALPAASLLHVRTNKTSPGGAVSDDLLVTSADSNAVFSAGNYLSADAGVQTAGTQVQVVDHDYTSPTMLGLFAVVSFPSPGATTAVTPAVPGSYAAQGGQGVGFSLPTLNPHYPSSRWQVLEAKYDETGKPIQFSANFDAFDAGGNAVVSGEVRLHSNLPLRGSVAFAADAFRAKRSDAGVTVTVTRAGDTSGPIAASYQTADYGAVQGRDYAASSGQLTWDAGDATPHGFTVPILPDAGPTGDRVFFVHLTGASLGTNTAAALTIVDDRQPPAATRSEPDGRVDTTFRLGLSNSSEVRLNAIAPLADGGALIGGTFVYANGPAQPGIVRLDAQGLPDAAFRSPFSLDTAPAVNAIAVQPDGKFVVAGHFGLAAGAWVTGLVRLNPDGSLDPKFNLDARFTGSYTVNGLALQPDGRIVAVGSFNPGSGLARLNADGSLDGSFAPPLSPYLQTYDFVVLQPDGRLIASLYLSGLKRFNADGSADPSFQPFSGSNTAGPHQVVLQPDGRLVLPPFYTQGPLLRFNHDGPLDPGFQLDPAALQNLAGIACLALQPDGKLLVGQGGRAGTPGLLRLNPDGSFDPSFQLADGLPSVVGAMAQEADGSLLISAGYVPATGSGVVHTVLARLAAVAPVAVKPTVTVAAGLSAAVKANGQAAQVVLTRTGDLGSNLTVVYTVKGKAVPGTDYAPLSGHRQIKAGQRTAVFKIRPLAGAPGRGALNVKIVLAGTDDYDPGTPAVAKVKILDIPAP